MIFAAPMWLFALLALPLVAAADVWLTWRDEGRTASLVARALWPRVLRRSWGGWGTIRLGLLLVGLACLILAMARPQWGIVREQVEREGVDVVFALDTSGSMAVLDVAPSRMFLARSALTSLLGRLNGDRVGLLAFEGEAYPLVPLTLDVDAVALFLDTVEPGIVPAPGTSLGQGLARGLKMFADQGRRNKVLVLVSDGEDLEGEVESAIQAARQAGVVVHTVGVGTESGQPVPDFDNQGHRTGFKKDEGGAPVVSRLHAETLQTIAQGTGGRFFRLTSTDPDLSVLGTTIEGMERQALSQEFLYRRKERYQAPLALGLASLAMGLGLPIPLRSSRRRVAALAVPLLLTGWMAMAPPLVLAQSPAAPGARATPPATVPKPGGVSHVLDEVLLRPRRSTEAGRAAWQRGDHPRALEAFDRAAQARPHDPASTYNLASSLEKNGRGQEAEPLLRGLGSDRGSRLAPSALFNLGNGLLDRRDYKEAVAAYRDSLRLQPGAEDARRNLELALRALRAEQERQQQEQKQDRPNPQQDQQEQEKQGSRDERQPQGKGQRPKTAEQKEQERFEREAGMPKERAMQILDALQRNEEEEQRKQLAARRAQTRPGRDW